MSLPPSAMGARSRDPEPSEPHGLGPRVKICSWSCLSWLHPLRSWSLRQTRGGSKRLQMIKELVPTLNRVALLVRESSPDTAQYVRESQTAARYLGVELQIEIERNPTDLEGIFVAARSADALVVADDAEFTAQRV